MSFNNEPEHKFLSAEMQKASKKNLDATISEIKKLVEDGFIKEDGTPLKCQECGGSNFKNGREWWMDGCILEEYEVICADCNSMVAQWSYGHWQI